MEDLKLNEIVVRPAVAGGVIFGLSSSLFQIESTNTAEARMQSATTTTGNEHTVEKMSTDGIIGTKISQGELLLVSSTPTDESEQRQPAQFARILFF